MWVLTTAVAALYVKEWVQMFKLPFLVTFAQSLVGSILMGLYLWFTNNLRPILIRGSHFDVVNILGGHALGTLLTNMANLQSSASFVNTLKACDPLFALIFAKFILKQQFSPLTHVSLIMIVFGIILACTTEFAFHFSGLALALISTGFFVIRSVCTKKLLVECPLDGQNIFFQISIFTAVTTGVMSIMEWFFSSPIDFSAPEFIPLLFKASVTHWSYNILSFWLVTHLSAMTYSVGNSVKRLITIYSSILYFRNPVSWLNALASLVAVAGVFLYSFEEARDKEKEKSPV